ncbi:iron ABC transporter permease [Vibrio sp. UCD-FRSSP16_10]|uniref:FecCD family ABC transporter permease n=1 Tax=unclassified Vibrio TaxID=2614977 RepID=UPI0008012121|nr:MULTISPECIES: iron ABC transporter permease [unclassified Vibrio]OBT15513.1 iron ABC transporter permease [Vibrio sp. UCD-FRSSP16_30]OBT20586.1 iron ABC transporter permease [Vibrio sp. UCD-FRSSP16_10]
MNFAPSFKLSTPALLGITLVTVYIASILSISVGPMDISFTQSMRALVPNVNWLGLQDSALPAHINMIVQQVRLPRTLLAIAIGGILAICGAVMQGLFRNPLADPGIIGVSAGAALGAALAIVVFGSLAQTYPQLLMFGTVPMFSFLGGAITTLLVYQLGTSPNGTSVTMMLLAGVAIGALSGAMLGLLNYYADDQALRDLSLWTMGSLAGANFSSVIFGSIILLILSFLFYRDAENLNALLLGEAEASHLGIDVQQLKRRLILLTAAGVGVTVSLAGMIGFIGLIVPHLGRMIAGPNHKVLIPLATVLGALLLLISDMLSRILVAPLEIPVGIITAVLGAPFFIWLLVSQKGRI